MIFVPAGMPLALKRAIALSILSHVILLVLIVAAPDLPLSPKKRNVTYVNFLGFGGGGKVFDWSRIPPSVPLPVVLSGGLSPANVTDGVLGVRPWAVDVSSGVEIGKGVKSGPLMRRFCKAVREADDRLGA